MRRCLLLILFSLLLVACGTAKYFSSERAAVAEYNSNCLWNLQIGRDYAAQGRYELAKEHLTLALAASDTPETKQIIVRELNSVDLMIQAQR